jgi:glycerophosphoryl diester phosphodiesterase
MSATPRPGPRLPIGFAHRGARAECRDNTIQSFVRAVELGAEGLESDVWLTSDGVAVLDHDGQIRRGLRRIPVSALRRDELPTHIPALVDLYRRCGSDFELSLDVKNPASARGAIDAAAGAGALSRLWLCGGGRELAGWRALSADVRLVASTSSARLAALAGVAASDPDGFDAGVGAVAVAGADAVNMRWPEWTAARVASVHAAGLLAFAWDAQRPAVIDDVLGRGVDAVYSDHVAVMTSAISRARGRIGGSEPVDAVERPDAHEDPADEQRS